MKYIVLKYFEQIVILLLLLLHVYSVHMTGKISYGALRLHITHTVTKSIWQTHIVYKHGRLLKFIEI